MHAGDEEAREILTKDLREAAAALPSSKPRKSWKKGNPITPAPPTSGPIVSRGFSSTSALHDMQPLPPAPTARWFTDEELAFSSMQGVNDSSIGGLPPGSFSLPDNSLRLDQSMGAYRTGAGMGLGDSDDDALAAARNGIDIPVSPTFELPSPMNPHNASGGSLSIPQHLNPDQAASASSPRQRRRLNVAASPAGSNSSLPGKAFSFQQPGKTTLPANAINHTGQSSYSLSADADLSPGNEVEDGAGMTELADVVGQLSLNENAEVRYHGRCVAGRITQRGGS